MEMVDLDDRGPARSVVNGQCHHFGWHTGGPLFSLCSETFAQPGESSFRCVQLYRGKCGISCLHRLEVADGDFARFTTALASGVGRCGACLYAYRCSDGNRRTQARTSREVVSLLAL